MDEEGRRGRGGTSEALRKDAKIIAVAGAGSGHSSTGSRGPHGVALVRKITNAGVS